MVKFEEKLQEFAKKHNLEYSKQSFDNVWGDGWYVDTYSIYNDTGCFTIHYLLQICEYSFCFSDKFSNERKDLIHQVVNVFEFEKSIWDKRSKIFGIRNPFFYLSFNKVVFTLIEVMEALAEKTDNIFGVKLNKG